ncbi:MAG: hypothetical protein NWF14_02565 [Candidatus Bathyarchaeota archaeon]|nr:hypothetical protein [Candidatus Bathyarchaeota archaeon]
MADLEEKERTAKDWIRIILPRVLRATLWGCVMGGEMLIGLYFLGMSEMFTEFLPIDQTGFSTFLLIFVGFEVAIQLLRGTIFPYALSVARALISMILLVQITNGGLMSITFGQASGLPLPPGMSITLTIDYQIILAAFLLLSLVSMVKNLLQTIKFVSEKTEEGASPPELP